MKVIIEMKMNNMEYILLGTPIGIIIGFFIGITAAKVLYKTKEIDRFTSLEQAAQWIGKEVISYHVEAPNVTGKLLRIDANGNLIVGNKANPCWFWNCGPVK